ncbi:hypothetical protein EDD11_008437 [Mortierella claussenii]|nr:hypothetical protein EDD11_008437 [Mortierella claussenii]
MAAASALGYYQNGRNSNQLLPIDLMIQIFMHLCQQPQDLLNCALATRHWSRTALQELYRHPWTYLFSYQFDTEGRVMDKHGSMLLLRTLFQGCMDPTRTTFPYASFARSVNLKWVHDTFDLPEVDIQSLTGFRWTRNEAPRDFLIRHLLANRPYLNDFVHCHAPRLPRCLFAHITTETIDNFADDAAGEGIPTPTALNTEGATAEGSISGMEPANTINTANTASTDSDDWANMMQQVTDDEFMTDLDMNLLATPPLLPVQQPIATAMPLVHPVATSSSNTESSSSSTLQLDTHHHDAQAPFAHLIQADAIQISEPNLSYTPPSPISLAPSFGTSGNHHSFPGIAMIEEVSETAETGHITEVTGEVEEAEPSEQGAEGTTSFAEVSMIESDLEPSVSSAPQSLPAIPVSVAAPTSLTGIQSFYAFQLPYTPAFGHLYSRTTTSSSVGSSSRPFLATWPLTMEQTHSLVYLDLRYAIVSDSLIVSLSLNCRKIEFLKVATHWQHFPHSYSVTDRALACLVATQEALKLVHVENHREISQGHELVRTIDTLANLHGSTLETLVLKSHDFQNCNLAGLGKACQKLVKFSAPGGMHLFREEVIKLTEACKLTLEHLDFSNSDIETDCLMSIMKSTATPAAAKGVLKALILLGMEDTLNQETCLAIGEHGVGLDCFRLDILESEAKDVSLMLSRPCALNLRVLTLGCHDVHGDLANDILDQIALNCRNVELLDVNHWQFSEKAIENVLRECGMLRYLNLSYTDMTEGTASMICKCLGEAKKEVVVQTASLSDDSLLTPLPTAGFSASFSASQMQTPATTLAGEAALLEPSIAEQGTIDDGAMLVEARHGAEDDLVEAPDEDRHDVQRKRGADMRFKGEGEDADEDYMDSNLDIDQQYATPSYSANGEAVKKQSQIGLVHRHANVMDLRTIMNLDLDEAIEMDLSMNMDDDTGMDLDMCLDLQRYHRSSFYKSDEGEEDAEKESEDSAKEENDVEMGDEAGDRECKARSKESKGKEVFVDWNEEGICQDGILSTVFSVVPPVYSSSYGSTSSASSSSSSSSTSAAKEMQSGQVLLRAAETGAHESFLCTPLLPALPIPSMQVEDPDAMTVSTSTSVAPASDASCAYVDSISEKTALCDSQTPPDSLATEQVGSVRAAETPCSFPTAKGPDGRPCHAMEEATLNANDSDSHAVYAWTKESRLEQVNVECCSLLSLASITKIKTLGIERQANLARQGRQRSRIWVENEHDMMMARLAVERGPESSATTRQRSGDSSAFHAGTSSNGRVTTGSEMEMQPEQEQGLAQSSPALALMSQREMLNAVVAASELEDEAMNTATALEVVA